jgi:hypothetical protein
MQASTSVLLTCTRYQEKAAPTFDVKQNCDHNRECYGTLEARETQILPKHPESRLGRSLATANKRPGFYYFSTSLLHLPSYLYARNRKLPPDPKPNGTTLVHRET